MNLAEDVVERIEGAGGQLALSSNTIRCRVPADAADLLDDLRAHKLAVLEILRKREEIPAMPIGVRMVRWDPKPAPVILTEVLVVTNVSRFISMTLLELKAALAGKRWQSGHWSVRELVDRLEQCGVCVEIESQAARASNG
jgi:hypothetical protein